MKRIFFIILLVCMLPVSAFAYYNNNTFVPMSEYYMPVAADSIVDYLSDNLDGTFIALSSEEFAALLPENAPARNYNILLVRKITSEFTYSNAVWTLDSSSPLVSEYYGCVFNYLNGSSISFNPIGIADGSAPRYYSQQFRFITSSGNASANTSSSTLGLYPDQNTVYFNRAFSWYVDLSTELGQAIYAYDYTPPTTINGGLVSLQSGNALVIDTLAGDVSQVGLFTTLPVKSSVFSDFRSGASYFVTDDLNSIKSTDFNTHAFTWNKQEGTTSILGQTDKGVYTINNPSGGRYIVIVNPRYMPRGFDHFLTNNPITVAISGTYHNLLRFALTQSNATLVTLADTGESLIESEEGSTNSFGGSVSFDDISSANPLPFDTPVVDWGTGNTPDYSDVPTLDNSVIGTATENLQGIRTEFNSFFATIRDCISWLPPQIVALLVGAMSLMVGIGIVKALL